MVSILLPFQELAVHVHELLGSRMTLCILTTGMLMSIFCFMYPGGSRHTNSLASYKDPYGHCTTKNPPKWSNEWGTEYPYETWEKDVLRWCRGGTELQEHQLGSAIALGLGGDARNYARELDDDLLVKGRPGGADPLTGITVMIPGYLCLLESLRNKFAMLPQEQMIQSITHFLQFTRQQGESTDQAISRYEILRYRAETLGKIQLNEVALSWLLLTALRVPVSSWSILLYPFTGNLPTTPAEFTNFTQYLRRNGHLYDRNNNSLASSGSTYYTQDCPEEYPTLPMYPAFADTTADDMSVSSAQSHDEEPVDLSDVAGMSMNAACEHVYMQYRVVKRQWRKLNNYGGKRTFFRRKGKGKGKSKGSKGGFKGNFKGKGPHIFYADGTPAGTQYEDHSEQAWAYAFTRKNPTGPDGQHLKCTTCGSDEHFRAYCPKGKGKGKGSGKGFGKGSAGPSGPSTFFASPDDWQYHDIEQQYMPAETSAQVASDRSEQPNTWTGFTVHMRPQPPAHPPTQPPAARAAPPPPPQYPAPTHMLSFVFWLQCYHQMVQLTGKKEGIMLDTGAIENLTGDGWVTRVTHLLHEFGQRVIFKPLARALGVEGVGTSANVCRSECIVPIVLDDGTVATYRAPVIANSQIPALWGLKSMKDKRIIIDTYNERMYMIGHGGYTLQLSPGSKTHQLQQAQSGHLMLPVTAYLDQDPRATAFNQPGSLNL
jgi:hypothetical protein